MSEKSAVFCQFQHFEILKFELSSVSVEKKWVYMCIMVNNVDCFSPGKENIKIL